MESLNPKLPTLEFSKNVSSLEGKADQIIVIIYADLKCNGSMVCCPRKWFVVIGPERNVLACLEFQLFLFFHDSK